VVFAYLYTRRAQRSKRMSNKIVTLLVLALLVVSCKTEKYALIGKIVTHYSKTEGGGCTSAYSDFYVVIKTKKGAKVSHRIKEEVFVKVSDCSGYIEFIVSKSYPFVVSRIDSAKCLK
jgi:hypothetical protein